jgi:hypothetical protein
MSHQKRVTATTFATCDTVTANIATTHATFTVNRHIKLNQKLDKS